MGNYIDILGAPIERKGKLDETKKNMIGYVGVHKILYYY